MFIVVAKKLIGSVREASLYAGGGREFLCRLEPHCAVGKLRILREDETLALHVQIEPSKAVRQGSRHVQQRLEYHIRSLIRQFRVDGRLGRIAVTAETAGGGKQPDIVGIEESPPTLERPAFFCGRRLRQKPEAYEKHEQHDGSRWPGYLSA